MTKADLQARATELGIKFQENDTTVNLELMIAGKESVDTIKALEEENAALKAAYTELTEENENLSVAKESGRVISIFTFEKKKYKVVGGSLNIPGSWTKDVEDFNGGKISVKDALKNKKLVAELVERGVAVEVESEKE